MFITGEFRRTIDDRWRLVLPAEMTQAVAGDDGSLIVAKERAGCISLWRPEDWQKRLESGMELLRQKIDSGRMEQRWSDVQRLGRLLSTRHQTISLAGRSRMLIPEGYRSFLGAESGETVLVVGAVICVEIWQADAWNSVLREEMPDFGDLFRQLTV
ncbi:MAG: division/cell wall cluster transcriptional repressor MraZ [Planctomycetaceae bacterium]|jgi:MraZ protein